MKLVQRAWYLPHSQDMMHPNTPASAPACAALAAFCWTAAGLSVNALTN